MVEAGSFSEAARRLAMPVSTVSRRVAELEDQLGVRLMERSTRSLRLTDVGSEVLEQAQRGVEVSDAVKSIVSNQLSDIYGLLRVSAPPSISESLLVPIITPFQAAYPNVRVQVLVTDRHVDPLTEGVDVVFRIGDQKDSALISRQILRYQHKAHLENLPLLALQRRLACCQLTLIAGHNHIYRSGAVGNLYNTSLPDLDSSRGHLRSSLRFPSPGGNHPDQAGKGCCHHPRPG